MKTVRRARPAEGSGVPEKVGPAHRNRTAEHVNCIHCRRASVGHLCGLEIIAHELACGRRGIGLLPDQGRASRDHATEDPR